MPQAKPPLEAVPPAPLTPAEAAFIRQVVVRYYGDNAVIRNYGPDPRRLLLHVETDVDPGMEVHECLGVLMCDLARDYVGLEVTKRGRRVWGNAKIAFRQGEVI